MYICLCIYIYIHIYVYVFCLCNSYTCIYDDPVDYNNTDGNNNTNKDSNLKTKIESAVHGEQSQGTLISQTPGEIVWQRVVTLPTFTQSRHTWMTGSQRAHNGLIKAGRYLKVCRHRQCGFRYLPQLTLPLLSFESCCQSRGELRRPACRPSPRPCPWPGIPWQDKWPPDIPASAR